MKKRLISGLMALCMLASVTVSNVQYIYADDENKQIEEQKVENELDLETKELNKEVEASDESKSDNEGETPVQEAAKLSVENVDADVSVTQKTVTVSCQNANTFLLPPKQRTKVEAGFAGKHGYTYGKDVGDDDVTALDVLAKVHEDIFGEGWEAFLAVNDSGFITTIFGEETGNCSFAVNGKQPHRDVWNEGSGGYPGYYTGYTINECIIEDSDEVEFFVYKDNYALDFYAWFEQGGKKIKNIDTSQGETLSVNLKGYSIGYYGSSNEETINQKTQDIGGATIVLVDESGSFTDIKDAVTNKDGVATFSFDEVGEYTISAYGDEYTPIISPICTVTVEEKLPHAAEDYEIETIDGVPNDWQNDLWLQYDYKQMTVGEKATIYPRRIPQIVGNSITNDVARPDFKFELISGNSIKIKNNQSNDKTEIEAVGDGISIVKVTYDEITYKEEAYASSSIINSAYAIYDVNSSPADVKIISSELEKQTSYDTIYFTDGKTVDFPFTVNTDKDVDNIEVTLNGKELVEKSKGKYVAPLQNSSNIIGITAKVNGKTKSLYRVIDARKIEIAIKNATSPESQIKVGDKVEISFKGIANPVPKLATIYNPTWVSSNPMFSSKGTYVHFDNEKTGTVKGYCSQWDLAEKNKITLNFTEDGEYDFTNGKIFSEWWGDLIGSDKNTTGNAPNLGAGTNEGEFCTLPDFKISVGRGVPTNFPVTGITLDKSEVNMIVGEKLKLTSNVFPESATDKSIIWKSNNEFFAKVDENGTVTAVSANTEQVKNVIITATTKDGNFIASCTITITATTIPVKGITLNKSRLYLVKGDKYKLIATIKPQNATNKEITWTSNEDKYVSVDENGLVKAEKYTDKKVSKVNITATTKDGSIVAKCVVSVVDAKEEDKDEANIVIDKIDKIGKVTLEKESVISDVKDGYNDLTVKQQRLVNNVNVLKDAITELLQLKAVKTTDRVQNSEQILAIKPEQKENATPQVVGILSEINKSIAVIPMDKDDVSDLSQAKVVELYKEYSNLSDKEKLIVKNSGILDNALSVIASANQTNKEMGIAVSNVDWNIKIVSKPISLSLQGINKMKDIEKKVAGKDLLAVWDIDLEDIVTGDVYSPQYAVQISLNAQNLPEYGGYAVVHYKDDGSIEYVDAEFKDGKATFKTKEFSPYAIVGYNGKSPFEELSQLPEAKDEGNNNIGVASLMLTGFGALAVALILKKKSQEEKASDETAN